MFFSITKSEVGNFADDITFYSSNKDIDHVFNDLYYDLNVLDWFKFNSLKANPDKFQFIILGANKNKSFSINVKGINIPSKNEVILLAITTDHELKLIKTSKIFVNEFFFQLDAFWRIRKYLAIEKAWILANAFIESQFYYAPLI